MIKTLQAIEDANVVILLVDAQADISEQDAHIAGYILEAGRALVVAVNKWDDITAKASATRSSASSTRKLAFLSFAELHTISARDGKGIGALLKAVDRAYAAAMAKLPTPRLTRVLQAAVAQQQPPRAGLVRPKLRYAHQGGMNPPVIVIHGIGSGSTSRTPTGAIWNISSSTRSNCGERRLGYNSRQARIPTRTLPRTGGGAVRDVPARCVNAAEAGRARTAKVGQRSDEAHKPAGMQPIKTSGARDEQ